MVRIKLPVNMTPLGQRQQRWCCKSRQ